MWSRWVTHSSKFQMSDIDSHLTTKILWKMVPSFFDFENDAAIFHQVVAVIWLFLTFNLYFKSQYSRIFTINLLNSHRFQNFSCCHKSHRFFHHVTDVWLNWATMSNWNIRVVKNVLSQNASLFYLENGATIFCYVSILIWLPYFNI